MTIVACAPFPVVGTFLEPQLCAGLGAEQWTRGAQLQPLGSLNPQETLLDPATRPAKAEKSPHRS